MPSGTVAIIIPLLLKGFYLSFVVNAINFIFDLTHRCIRLKENSGALLKNITTMSSKTLSFFLVALLFAVPSFAQSYQSSESKNKDYYYYADENLPDKVLVDSLMKFLKRKFPQADCNTCMSRTIGTESKVRNVEKYDPVAGQSYYVKEYYKEATVRLRNKCNKPVRVLGLSKGYMNRRLVYGIVWKDYEANFSTSFSRESDNLAGSLLGGIFSSMVFGGGEMSDIDLSSIGKRFDNSINPGEYQYLRVIALSAEGTSSVSPSGGKTVEVTSYVGGTKTNVKKGDKIYIRATGSVKTGAFSGYTGPNGQQYTPMWNIVPAYNYGALLAKVGNSSWMLAGEEAQLVAPAAGILTFAINDTDPSDNYGSFSVEYSINKPLAKIEKPKPEVSSNEYRAPKPEKAQAQANNRTDGPVTTVKVDGTWTMENTNWEYGCYMKLKIDGNNKVRGTIEWTLIEIDDAAYNRYRGKENATSTETVEGTFDPETNRMELNGISEDDPYGITGLNSLTLRLKDDDIASGKTRADGSWKGRIRGTYTIRRPQQ